MITKLHAPALANMLANVFSGACECGELSKMNAVHAIIEKERFYGLDGLLSTIANDAVDFLMVAAPGFDRDLKIATGRSRADWLSLVS
jgi:hypothetical protein